MSDTPMSSGSSPQKRPQSAETTQPAKRLKTEEPAPTMDDILKDDLGLPNFGLPDDIATGNDPLLQMPSFSSPSSALNTPQQAKLELPLPDLSEQSTALVTPQPLTTPAPTNVEFQLPTGSASVSTTAGTTPAPSQPPSQQQQAPLPANGTTATTSPTTTITATTQPQQQPENPSKPGGSAADPDKLSDALLVAGVDLKAEEALLNQQSLQTKPAQFPQTGVQQPIIVNTPFLDPRQVAVFVNKVIAAFGLRPNTENDAPLIQIITYATEEWMKNILTNAVVLSRHRRRSIKNKRRSELTVALRDMAVRSKTLEDERQNKKRNAGIVQTEQGEAAEEVQHKATNATVAMMTGKKKKYDWMNAGSSNSKAGMGDVSTRFREAREEQGVIVRDLLNSLEKKRMGVDKTLAKGYAKLKD